MDYKSNYNVRTSACQYQKGIWFYEAVVVMESACKFQESWLLFSPEASKTNSKT